MMETSPCKDCTEKYTACHDHCDKYKGWKERYQAQQKHLRDNRYRMCIPMSHAREQASNHYLKHPLHKSGGDQ